MFESERTELSRSCIGRCTFVVKGEKKSHIASFCVFFLLLICYRDANDSFELLGGRTLVRPSDSYTGSRCVPRLAREHSTSRV